MIFALLGKGLLVGLVFGVPAGAIGALTIQRTLTRGFMYGFLTGLGSSAADVIYASIGVFGITIITDFLRKYELLCGVGGSVLIIIYGVLMIRRKNQVKEYPTREKKTYVASFLSAFSIAIMNPATVVSFLVAFSSFGLMGEYSVLEGSSIVLGVFIGTVLWWYLLSFITEGFKAKVTNQIYSKLNLILGSLLIAFGAAMSASYIL